MTLTLVIDQTLGYEIAWDGDAEDLRKQIQQWMTRSERTVLTLSNGATMLVNWPAVKTVQVGDSAGL